MADTALSGLTELTAPVTTDELYIRDESEIAALESKRITLATMLAFVASFKDTATSVTASATQTQGQSPLTKALNIVTTVANEDDTCTAIASAATGQIMLVLNQGANQMQLFPAANDILNTTGELIADQPVFIDVGDFYCGIRVTSTQWIHVAGTVSI